MSQYITIKNFGPISEVTEMEVKDFMLFIGERATGKSTIVKTTFFFKLLRDDLIDYFLEILRSNDTDEKFNRFASRAKDRFMQFWGPSLFLDENMYLKFQYSEDPELSIEITIGQGKLLTITPGSTLLSSYNRVFKSCMAFRKKHGRISLSSTFQETFFENFQKSVVSDVNNMFRDESRLVFIPAQRSLLTTLSGQTITDIELDFLTNRFVRDINRVKSWISSLGGSINEEAFAVTFSKKVRLFRDRSEKLLQGKYSIEKGVVEFLVLPNGYKVKLNYASSGQQESLWILNILQFLLHNTSGNFIVIEEPESHLDPRNQKEIIEIISAFSKITGNRVVITTHSPYILASLNNLMYANIIGVNHGNEVKEIVPETVWINPENLRAYEVKEGKAVLIHDEQKLIKNEELDRISSVINSEYNSLFNIENQVADEL